MAARLNIDEAGGVRPKIAVPVLVTNPGKEGEDGANPVPATPQDRLQIGTSTKVLLNLSGLYGSKIGTPPMEICRVRV